MISSLAPRVLPLALLSLSTLACEAPAATGPGPTEATTPQASTSKPGAARGAIDWDARAAEALAEADQPGAIVVLAAEGGAVLASVERPGLSPHPATEPRPPGSTVKPFLALAAVHEGKIDPDQTLSCAGPRQVEGQTLRCFADHGELDLAGGLRTSCNHYAYGLAERLGRETIDAHFERFGIATGGGVDGASIVGIGHGGVRLSPLALAQAYASLATGTVGPSHDWPYGEELGLVHAALRGAVEHEEGTGRAAAVEGLAVAGKTGTAEIDHEGEALRLSYFVGWAPAEDPEVVVVVQIEGEGTGPEVAAPVAGRMFAALAP